MQQLELCNYLDSADRVLFVIDPLVRNIIYFQGYLAELIKIYPRLKVDLFINDTKNILFLWRYKAVQIKYLKDIFREKYQYINNVYFNSKASLKIAKLAKYPLIVLLNTNFSTQQVKLAKYLSPKCVLIGVAPKISWYNFCKKRLAKCINLKLSLENSKLDIFTHAQPILQIPKKWIIYAKLRFLKWGIDKRGQRFGRVIFVNSFDDDGGHALSLKNLYEIIIKLKKDDQQGDINLVLHTSQDKFHETKKFFDKNSINNLFLFCACYDFFQIPSLLSISDLVYSVDGFCVDLANAFNIPVVKIDKNLCTKL